VDGRLRARQLARLQCAPQGVPVLVKTSINQRSARVLLPEPHTVSAVTARQRAQCPISAR